MNKNIIIVVAFILVIASVILNFKGEDWGFPDYTEIVTAVTGFVSAAVAFYFFLKSKKKPSGLEEPKDN